MADIDLKTETPDTSLPANGFLFGADSQSAAVPSVYTVAAVKSALVGGSDTQVQFNDGGAFGGDSGFTFNKTTGRLSLPSSGQFAFSTDLILTRRAAANLRLGAADAAAPVAQTLSVQSVVAGTTNTAGANFTITGSQGTGTGAGGSIIFQVAPVGASGTAQNGLQTVLQITGAGGLTGQDGVTANTLALRNGTNAQTFRVYNTFTDASNYERGFARWNSNVLEFGAEAAGTGANRLLRFTSAFPTAGVASWEFRSTSLTSPTLVIAGTDRSVSLSVQQNMLQVSGGILSAIDYAPGASSTYSLRSVNGNLTTVYFGLSGAAAGVMQVNNGAGRGSGYGASIEMWEMTAPAAPAANGVRIYAEDDGAGKTRLMARFATGAAVQIAIEP